MHPSTAPVRRPAQIGALLFLLWGVLHLWVGYEGLHQYLSTGVQGQWNLLLGGSQAPREAFVHTTDALTGRAHAQLILNFCIDVAGYGILALVVAGLIGTMAERNPLTAWAAYGIGLLVIGIGDLAFLFAMVVPGIIELNAGTVGGPVLWFLAVLITPFGLPPLRGVVRTI